MLKRRELLKGALGAGLYAGLPHLGIGEEGAQGTRPNFVFICADDLGWGDLGAYGHPEIQTPNLDRLASQGTLFTQFYCGGPVCSPSRAAYLTGLSAAKTKILRPLGSHAQSQQMNIPDFLNPAFPTVMRQLKQAGYVTGHFGKWHMTTHDAPGGPPLPPAYGVQEYKIELSEQVAGPGHCIWTGHPHGPNHVTDSDQYIFDAGIKFIESHREQPFYVALWSFIPHIPLYPTAEQMAPFHSLRPNDPWPVPKQIYYAAVKVLDDNVGRVLKRLDELGLADNTVIVFTSDHGPENVHLNEDGTSGMGSTGPFRGHKVSLYEGGIRVPFLVRWPGRVPAGRVEDASIIGGVDLLPTFCGLANVKVPPDVQKQLDGEDVSDILLGASRARRTTLYWENRFWHYAGTNDPLIHRSPILAMRQGDWKLLANPDGSRQELYHIPRDPSEIDNKMDVQPELGERLTQQLLKWYESMPGGVITIPPNTGDNTYPWPTSGSVAAINQRHGPLSGFVPCQARSAPCTSDE